MSYGRGTNRRTFGTKFFPTMRPEVGIGRFGDHDRTHTTLPTGLPRSGAGAKSDTR
jgi:hypothetical protein